MNFMTAWVEIKAEIGGLKVDLTEAEKLVQQSVLKMKNMFATLGHSIGDAFQYILQKVKWAVMLAGGALTTLIYKTVQLASSAAEMKSKFERVFKYLTTEAEVWVRQFGKSVGRATDDVRAWMANLQNILIPLGFAREKAFELSKSLVKLAVDVAAFNNVSDTEVIGDFTAALIGQTRAVRSYGILLTETLMKEEARRMGIKKSYSDLTTLEEAQIRFNLILRLTKDAQGEAIRSMSSYASQVRIFKAAFSTLSIEIGKVFMPIMTEAFSKMSVWLTTNQDVIVRWFAIFKEKILAAKDIVMEFFGASALWQTKLQTLWKVFLSGLSEMLKTAVVIGYYGGKLIYQAIKEGIFGGTEKQITELAGRRYRAAGGKFTGNTEGVPKEYIIQNFRPSPGGLSGGSVRPEAPTDLARFEQYRRSVEQEMIQKKVETGMEPAFRYADEAWKRWQSNAKENFGRIENGQFNLWAEYRWKLADKLAEQFMQERAKQERVIIDFTPEAAQVMRVAGRFLENAKAGAQAQRTK